MTKQNNRIIIFGFSGAGKSTLADMLGSSLNLRVVHPSSILQQLLLNEKIDRKNTKAGEGFWETSIGKKLLKSRLKQKSPMDLICDEILLKELKNGKVVMDSWNMPWLSKGSAIRICLKASLKDRVDRVSRRSGITKKAALSSIASKDNDTRKIFQRIYGIDIKKDIEVFDLMLDTSSLTKKSVLKSTLKFINKKKTDK